MVCILFFLDFIVPLQRLMHYLFEEGNILKIVLNISLNMRGYGG